MSTSAGVDDTPYYVLMDGNRRIGPNVVQLRAGIECSPIYGFSDKGSYDKFCTNSQQALKPYPLVTGYLRNQIDAPDDSLKLVVLDAAGPSEAYLHAATMEVVLEAHESPTIRLNAGYRLMLDEEDDAYRVEESPLCLVEPIGSQDEKITSAAASFLPQTKESST